MIWHQIRYEQLSFWRNPQSAFFTFVFPVVVIAIFGALFGGEVLSYYVPTIAAVSVIGSCFGQLAIVLAARRQNGILKRVRATPLPAATYFAGLLAHCVLVSVLDVLLVTAVGRLYGVPLPDPGRLPGLLATLVLGAAAFCSIGVAVASLIRNAEAAPAVVQLVQFPLVFLAGTYMPITSDALNAVSDLLPIRPFNQALLYGLSWQGAGVLLAWGLLGAVVAIRRFRWDPRPE